MHHKIGVPEIMLRGKFTAPNTYIGKRAKYQINHLIFYISIFEKEDEIKLTVKRRKETTYCSRRTVSREYSSM
jgi:hypothetical protein